MATNAAMDRPSSAVAELHDMTECSICREVFTDPRALPCIHTFCLRCLQRVCADKQPGDRMRCPMCRKEFTIPDDGLSGLLQKNFYVETLLRRRKKTQENSSLPPVSVTFTPSTLLDREDRNLVGTVTEQGQLKQHFSSRI